MPCSKLYSRGPRKRHLLHVTSMDGSLSLGKELGDGSHLIADAP
jgi:hypothetical protein